MFIFKVLNAGGHKMKITDLQKKYELEKTDFWEMKFGGRAIWIITHDGCEKIAAKEIAAVSALKTF